MPAVNPAHPVPKMITFSIVISMLGDKRFLHKEAIKFAIMTEVFVLVE